MHESACPRGECDGTGFVYLEETNAAKACRCQIDLAKRRHLSEALPRGRYREVARDRNPIADLRPSIQQSLDRWLADIPGHLERGEGLWLESRGRHGKRSAAALLVKEAIEAGHTAAFWSARSLMARLRDFEHEAELLDQLVEVDLLALVDLGFDNPTGWVREQLHLLIDGRYMEQRSLVVTTELSPAELEQQLTPAIVDRIGRICGDTLAARVALRAA